MFDGEDKDYLIKMPYGLRVHLTFLITIIAFIVTMIGIHT